MILGFRDRFIPYVLDGSKTHTIRAGNRWRAGMRADLFRNVRQKDMTLLFRAPVVRVQTVVIASYEAVQEGRGPIPALKGNHCLGAHRGPHGESMIVLIDGEMLAADECRSFFRRDGFREPGVCPQYQALTFWNENLPFRGQIIHWDYAERFTDVSDTCYNLTRSQAKRYAA